MDYANKRILARIPLPLIFAGPTTKYEAWKIEKEFNDLVQAKNILQKSVEDLEYKGSASKSAYEGVRVRALRLRSRGYGSGLREVISVDEKWTDDGWASSIYLPDGSYDARIELKMRNRPFLLENDPTDRSGIIPRSQVQKMLGGG